MSFTYILKSQLDGSYYIGSTRDLKARLLKHNKGSVKSTKNKRPLKLVYKEIFLSYSEAAKRERQIKKWKKRISIENLINKNGPVV